VSETKESYKWYWAYTSSYVDGTTFIFNTYDETLNHAIANGEFEEIYGKDAFIDYEQELLFEVGEDELEEYSPIKFISLVKGEAA
jgi:hypothetical protein